MSVRSPLGATSQSGGWALAGRRDFGVRDAVAGRSGPLALAGLTFSGALIAVAAAHTSPLLPESIRPAQAVGLAGAFNALGLNLHAGGTMIALVAMLGCYTLAVLRSGQLSARAVFGAIGALYAILLLAPPLISTDIFSYQSYSRMGAVYGVNPYLNGPYGISLDPLFHYVGAKWAYTPTVYGPVFTTLSFLLAPLGVVTSVLAYKLIAAVSALAIVAMVFNLARRRGVDPVRAAALVGLNPLLVLYGVGGGHNDLLMLVPLVAAVYATTLGRERLGGGMTVLAVGIKLSAGLIAPFAIVAGGARRERGGRRKLLISIAVSGLAVIALGVGVFGTGVFQLFATVQESQSRGDWHSVPGLIVTLGATTIGHVVGLVFTLAFLAVTVRLLRRVWREEMDWIDAAAWATFAMLVCANSLLPWYVAWLLPLTAVSRDRRLLRWTLILTCFVQVIQLPGYIPHAASMIGY